MTVSAQPQQTLRRLRDAIDRAAAGAPVLWVSSCGYISRDLHALGDGPNHFYLVGSMGMALPVALGVASIRPDRFVVALDGDGSALMNLTALPMCAALDARNLIHIVLDNGMHESTGGQRTIAPSRLGELMTAAGYPRVHTVRAAADLPVDGLLPGPTGIHVLVAPRTTVAPRVAPSPPALVQRTRAWLGAPR